MTQTPRDGPMRGHTALMAWIARDGTDTGWGWAVPVGPGAERRALRAAANAVLQDPAGEYLKFRHDLQIRADLESGGWDCSALIEDCDGWEAREWNGAVETLRSGGGAALAAAAEEEDQAGLSGSDSLVRAE